ncbi:MAG: hypothetical protein AAFX44_07740 [Pseudomonadota bacterium]
MGLTGIANRFLAALALIVVATPGALAESYVEIRDPLRGVTFYSVQLSTDTIRELSTSEDFFGDMDEQVTLGLSAFYFDESERIDEFVMWLRHDGGSRWFSGPEQTPMSLSIDDGFETLPQLHALPTKPRADGARLVEKLEFTVSPKVFAEMKRAERVVVELSTLMGAVSKSLTLDEIAYLQRFEQRISSSHDAIKKVASDAGVELTAVPIHADR